MLLTQWNFPVFSGVGIQTSWILLKMVNHSTTNHFTGYAQIGSKKCKNQFGQGGGRPPPAPQFGQCPKERVFFFWDVSPLSLFLLTVAICHYWMMQAWKVRMALIWIRAMFDQPWAQISMQSLQFASVYYFALFHEHYENINHIKDAIAIYTKLCIFLFNKDRSCRELKNRGCNVLISK